MLREKRTVRVTTATHTRGLSFVRPSGHVGSCIRGCTIRRARSRASPPPPSRTSGGPRRHVDYGDVAAGTAAGAGAAGRH
eukprot:2908627-Prymnesium_polylepis.1